MGLNPRVKDSEIAVVSNLAVVQGSGTYLTISFRQSLYASGTSFVVEGSSDLINWDTQNSFIGSIPNNGDGTQTLTYRDSVALTGENKRFMRVRATVP
jgi:hypothetical protein